MKPQSSSDSERVLLVIDSLGPGGAEHALLALARGLVGRGHECTVVAFAGPHNLRTPLEEGGIAVRAFEFGQYRHFTAACAAVSQAITAVRPTAIEAHLLYAGHVVALTRVWAPSPVRIAVFHNLGYASYPVDSIRRRVRLAADRAAMRWGMDAYVGVSGAVAEHYRSALGLASVEVISNALEVDRIRASRTTNGGGHRTKFGLAENTPTLLCAGRFRHEKGHRFLVSAVDKLRRRGVTLQVFLAGDGPLRQALEAEIAARKLADTFVFTGRLDRDELFALMSSVDAVVMPSTYEGLGMTALEASVLGVPVIATTAGGLPDAIEQGETGVLVPPGEPEALAHAIESVLHDEGLRARLRANALARSHSDRDASTIATAHLSLIARTRATRQ